MKILYDRNIKIAGLGLVPWMRLGLEKWFDDYKIVALNSLDSEQVAHTPEVISLDGQAILKKSAQSIVNSNAFRELAENRLNDYYILPYRPVAIPGWVDGRRFLITDMSFTQTFENKVWLREHFGSELPFAPFVILEAKDIEPTFTGYRSLARLGDKLVLQQEQSTGGKGTFFVNNFEEYTQILPKIASGGKVVVSKFVAGRERSIQCCATRYGVMVGGLQKQIVRAPQLTNLNLTPVHGFCGGEVGVDYASGQVLSKIEAYAKRIGDVMYGSGYRGIFGLDVLVNDDEVTVLEINARTTGLTPLINAVYGQNNIPFYLLHVLELGNFDYEITDSASAPSPKGSLMLLHNKLDIQGHLGDVPKTGMYRMIDTRLQLLRQDVRFNANESEDAFLVEVCVESGATVTPGERLFNVFLQHHVTDNEDKLLDSATALIEALYNQCKVNVG